MDDDALVDLSTRIEVEIDRRGIPSVDFGASPVREERERIASEFETKIAMCMQGGWEWWETSLPLTDMRTIVVSLRAPESAPPPTYSAAEIQAACGDCWREDLDPIGNIWDLAMLSRHRDAERGDRNASPPINVRSTERELTDDVR